MFKKKDGLVQLETKKLGDKDVDEGRKEPVAEEKSNVHINDIIEDKDDKSTEDIVKEDPVMDELVKEIEELENEVERKDAEEIPCSEKPTATIDWGDSALSHLKEEVKDDKS